MRASDQMTIDVRVLGPGDAAVLRRVAPDVFDGPIDARWSAEFLADPRHHLAVAIEDGVVVGMASGLHYVHPDKPPELWVNEVGVTPTHQGRGVGRRVLTALLAHGRALGCAEAWVLTHHGNTAARRMYAAVGGVDADAPLLISFALDDLSDVTTFPPHEASGSPGTTPSLGSPMIDSEPWPFESAVRDVVAQLARGEYAALERRSSGVRLSAGEMKAAVAAYGRRIVVPPEGAAPPLDVVRITAVESPAWAVDVPLWTAEEGPSDLTLQLTVRADPDGGHRIEIADLRVL